MTDAMTVGLIQQITMVNSPIEDTGTAHVSKGIQVCPNVWSVEDRLT